MTSRKSTQDLIIPIVQDGDVSSKKEKKVANDSVPCLFLDLKDWSRSWQFVILSASVFFFYLVRYFFFKNGKKNRIHLFLKIVSFAALRSHNGKNFPHTKSQNRRSIPNSSPIYFLYCLRKSRHDTTKRISSHSHFYLFHFGCSYNDNNGYVILI